MASNQRDDLSDLLNQLADKQQREAAELGALLEGGAAAPTPQRLDADLAPAVGPESDEDATTLIDPEVDIAKAAGGTTGDEPDAAATVAEDDMPADALFAAEPQLKDDAPSAAAATASDAEPSSAGATTVEDDLAAALAGTSADVDAESAEAPAFEMADAPAFDMADAPVARRRERPVASAQSGTGLKAIGAPIFVLLGLVTLVPAVWGTLLLAGMNVPLKNTEGASSMAKVMLVTWPIGIFIIAVGIRMMLQVLAAAAKAKQAKQAKLEAEGK